MWPHCILQLYNTGSFFGSVGAGNNSSNHFNSLFVSSSAKHFFLYQPAEYSGKLMQLISSSLSCTLIMQFEIKPLYLLLHIMLHNLETNCSRHNIDNKHFACPCCRTFYCTSRSRRRVFIESVKYFADCKVIVWWQQQIPNSCYCEPLLFFCC